MYLFVTHHGTNGNFGGIQGADYLCDTDPNRPKIGARFKAVITDIYGCGGHPCRRAALSPFASNAGRDEQIDWPLFANYHYKRWNDKTEYNSTTSSYNLWLNTPWAAPLWQTNKTLATGLNKDWTSNTSNCDGWQSSSSSLHTSGGWTAMPNPSDDTTQFLSGHDVSCGGVMYLLCAEQPWTIEGTIIKNNESIVADTTLLTTSPTSLHVPLARHPTAAPTPTHSPTLSPIHSPPTTVLTAVPTLKPTGIPTKLPTTKRPTTKAPTPPTATHPPPTTSPTLQNTLQKNSTRYNSTNSKGSMRSEEVGNHDDDDPNSDADIADHMVSVTVGLFGTDVDTFTRNKRSYRNAFAVMCNVGVADVFISKFSAIDLGANNPLIAVNTFILDVTSNEADDCAMALTKYAKQLSQFMQEAMGDSYLTTTMMGKIQCLYIGEPIYWPYYISDSIPQQPGFG